MRYRLGEICRFQSGGTPAKGNPEYFNGTIPWITTVALNGGQICEENAVEWITEKAIKESAAKIVPAYSIMVGTRVGVGKVAVNIVPMSTSQDIISLLEIDETKWYKDFLCKFIQAKSSFLNLQARGATIKGIKIDVLSNRILPDVSIEEQIHISRVIDNVRSVISDRQQELEKLDDLIKARFVEMFGDLESGDKYPQISIKDFTEVISGGTPDRKNNEYWENGTVPWVKTTELQNNRINFVEECITVKGLDESSAKVVPKDTVLVAMYGQGKTRGMTAILGVPASTNQACACILPCEKVEPEYLWQYMILSYERLRNLAQGGNQPNLNGNMIKNFTVLMPPKALQVEFVRFVKQIDKSKASVQAALDKAQLLFDSLMQQYFG